MNNKKLSALAYQRGYISEAQLRVTDQSLFVVEHNMQVTAQSQ